MLYTIYDCCELGADVARTAATSWANVLRGAAQLLPEAPAMRAWRAGCDVAGAFGLSHTRPDFAIQPVVRKGRWYEVADEAVIETPFCTIRRFTAGSPGERPMVLLVAPMSGHFATLLRPTVQQMVVDHDVYLTDWHNARDVPLHLGEFGLDAFVGLLVDVVTELGPEVHVMAVCQPCVPALAAVAVLAERGIEPRSLTLVAGPIDGRVAPTTVNALATSHPLEWFERHLISVVPMRFAGRGRRVYPGFLQLGGFLAMNPQRHLRSQLDRFGHLAMGDDERAAAIGRFYEEYLAVMDLPGAFYLETVQRVFQEFELARGEMTFQGKVVDPGLIRRTPLLTVEAERDDMCAPGQTAAAHDLCTGLPDHLHDHHLQAGVGHYGVFSGRRWEREIYPRVSRFIAEGDALSGRSA